MTSVSEGLSYESPRGTVELCDRHLRQRVFLAVADGLTHDRLLLMTTADDTDPARRLYASEGWHVLGPGIGDDTAIMGKRPGGASTSFMPSETTVWVLYGMAEVPVLRTVNVIEPT